CEHSRLHNLAQRGHVGGRDKPGPEGRKETSAHASAFPRQENARVMHRWSPSRSERAQGMPDAGRTREPCVQRKVHFAHASNNRAARTTGIPCAMVYGLYVVSSECRAC